MWTISLFVISGCYDLYIRGHMKNYTKPEILKIILSVAKEYDEKLNDKHFRITYQKGKNIEETVVGFRDMNFLHLTGVKTKLSAQQFYQACINAKLSERDFEIDNKGKVQQKIAVLPYLPNLLYGKCMIGDFINSGIMIRADYFVGDTRATISVGFKVGNAADIPVTLYHEDVRKLSHPTCKVLEIRCKKFDETEYNLSTYIGR